MKVSKITTRWIGSKMVGWLGTSHLAIYLSFFFLLTVFMGCGKIEEKKELSAKRVITLWETYNNEEHREFVKIAKEFEKLNPDIKINVQRIPWGGHQTKLMTAMITHTAPDIARVDVAFIPRLVSSKSVVCLDQFGAQKLKNNFVKAAIDSNIIDGKIYGFPDQTTGVALFYNKDMFDKAGIKNPPKTWKEFIVVAKRLTLDSKGRNKEDLNFDKSKTQQYGFAMDNSLWWSFPFFNTYGVKFLNEERTECLLNNPVAIEALQLKVDLYQKHKVEAGAWQSGAISPDMGFINKKYAMIFSGQWNLKTFKDAKIDFGVSLIPEGPKGTSTNVGGTNMVILRETKYPEEAYKFLEFITSPKIQAKWCNLLGQIPINLKAYNLIDTSNTPELKVFMEQMKYAIARPPVISYDHLEEFMNMEMYAALSGNKSVEDALKDAVKRINEEVLKED